MLKWWFLIFAWLCAGIGFAQNTIGLPLVKNFSKTEFKGGSQTWGIDQDAFGRMYFANNEGLITFDGSYWRNYPLPNLTIARSVKVASQGRVYVGGQGEAGYFLPDGSGGLKYHSILSYVPEASRNFADIWNIEWLGDAVFFRATDRILAFSSQTVRVFPAPREWMYLEKIGDRLFAQDKEQGLFTWAHDGWKPVGNGNISAGDAFHGAISLSPDSLVLVTYHNQNFLFTGNTLSRCQPVTPPILSEVVSIRALNNSEYAMGTTGEGCIVLNRQGQTVQRITMLEGMQDNSILCCKIDRDGNLWTGLNNGISLIAYNAAIKFIKPNRANELSGYSARVFNNELYIATNDGAYKVPLASGLADLGFSKGSFAQVPQSNGLAYRLDEVNDQLMLAHNEGTFHISSNNALRLSADASWLFVPLSGVAPAARILVGNYVGLKWLNYAGGQFKATANLRGLKESFRFLAVDNDQQVWASHPYRGIFKVHFSADSMGYTTTLFTEKDGLPSTLDNHVFRVKNRVVFATSQGIYEYDKAKNRFEPSGFLIPMLGKTPVRYLREDQEGNLWFVSGKKLAYLAFQPSTKQGFTITYFPEITGQILSGFENIFPYNRQNVFVASERGVILLNLQKYLQAKERKKVILSSVHAIGAVDSVIYKGFEPGSAGLPESANSLPYKLNSLHFEYSAPAYGFQENIEYSYILEGYETEWSKWNAKPEKDYTNLPNGSFVFKVKAKSNLGVEAEYARFAFTIAPPWYKSGPAWVAYVLLLGAGLYLLNHYHRKKLERQKRNFEEKQEQLRVLHQLEIEKSEKEIIRLQNEKLASEVSFKNRELADTSMHLVERSDALQKVKESVQKLYKAEPSNSELKRALHQLNEIERNNSDWGRFAASFDEINNDFLKKLKTRFPTLTNNDLKLCAYLQINMSSKEVSQLLNISIRGVEISRYRLRKKLGIPTEASISGFLNEMVKE